jgi:hypothetical protein
MRCLGWLALLALIGCYAGWTYLALAFGLLLGWTVPGWAWAVVALTALAAAVTLARPRPRLRVPLVLPLGIWIAVVLSGWLREEYLIRCDDYLGRSRRRSWWCRRNPILPRAALAKFDGRGVSRERSGKRRMASASCSQRRTGGRRGPDRCSVRSPPRRSRSTPLRRTADQQVAGLIDLREQNRLLAMQWGPRSPVARMARWSMN